MRVSSYGGIGCYFLGVEGFALIPTAKPAIVVIAVIIPLENVVSVFPDARLAQSAAPSTPIITRYKIKTPQLRAGLVVGVCVVPALSCFAIAART